MVKPETLWPALATSEAQRTTANCQVRKPESHHTTAKLEVRTHKTLLPSWKLQVVIINHIGLLQFSRESWAKIKPTPEGAGCYHFLIACSISSLSSLSESLKNISTACLCIGVTVCPQLLMWNNASLSWSCTSSFVFMFLYIVGEPKPSLLMLLFPSSLTSAELAIQAVNLCFNFVRCVR